MARFSSLAKGTKAVRDITLQYDGKDVPLGIRVLSATELAGVFTASRAYAKARGVEDPKDGTPLYDLALQAETLAVACIDTEDHKRSFFANAEEVRDDLDDDQIQYVYEHYLLWKDEQSPQHLKYTPEEIYRTCTELGVSEDAGPFLRMRPGLRLICMRFMARQWLSSLGISLGSFSDSGGDSSTTAPTPEAES